LVLAGFVAAKRGWLPLDAIPGLNGFVLYFALALHAVSFRCQHAHAAVARRFGGFALLLERHCDGVVGHVGA
jgi:hypothetical protein